MIFARFSYEGLGNMKKATGKSLVLQVFFLDKLPFKKLVEQERMITRNG